MLTLTHMLFGTAMAQVLKLPKWPAFIMGFLVDMDFLLGFLGIGFPFIHRGFVHTPIFIIAITLVWYFGRDKSQNALSAGAGGLGHLLLDFFTNQGIMLLYPLAAFFAVPLVDYANVAANAGICLLSAAVVLAYTCMPKMFGYDRPRCKLYAALALVAIAFVITVLAGLLPFSYDPLSPFLGTYY